MTQKIVSIAGWYLEEWSIWSKNRLNLNLNYSNESTFDKFIIKKNRKSERMQIISDEEAMIIDSIVSDLALRDKELHSILCDYFLQNKSIPKISRDRDIYKNRVWVLLHSGISWVDAMMYIHNSSLTSKSLNYK